MASTYSINVGSSQEASSYDTITSVLSLLPDNTSKLISPRDVRDAIFSSWESSVLRYTKNSSSTEYIGIDRSDVKTRFFFGKKELSGSEILSNSLLTSLSTTDIFFYNTKSDSSATQNLKISFISGSSSTLWPNSPYISVDQISGSTPSLNFNITNPGVYAGDINLYSNQGRVSLNNLIFPSVSEITTMIGSPSSALPTDLYLVRTSTGYLELREFTVSGSSTLGVTGSDTYIYGDNVYLNNSPLEFTDSTPILATFGSIGVGFTFSNVALVEMIRQMLYPYLSPISTITPNSLIVEREHSTDTGIEYSYTITKKSNDISYSIISIYGSSTLLSESGPVVTGDGIITNSYSDVFTYSGANISANTLGIFTYSILVNDGTQSYTAYNNVSFVYPYFYGFSVTSSVTALTLNTQVLPSLTKLVDDEDSQSVYLAGTGYLYYCYPSDYGTLSTIYDGNSYLIYQHGSTSSNWTYSLFSANSPTSKWATKQYYVYKTLTSVTIPLPSQLYQFDF